MRPWNTKRAKAYGGAIGLGAAVVKSFAPWSDAASGADDGQGAHRRDLGVCAAVRARCGVAGEVISLVPAKAGTESSKTLDSRLRGNDRRYVPRAAMYSASAAAFDTLRLLIAPGSASRANRSQVAPVS